MFKKKIELFRFTVELGRAHAEKVERLADSKGFGTKRAVFEAALDCLEAVFAWQRRGFRIRIVDPANSKQMDFASLPLPIVEPIREQPTVFIRATDQVVRRLLQAAKACRDYTLDRAVALIAASAWNPSGTTAVETTVLHELAYIATRTADEELLSAARDLFTVQTTAFASFEDLVQKSRMGYTPSFDTTRIEQRFLADEFRLRLETQKLAPAHPE